jgi:hypothetical protein
VSWGSTVSVAPESGTAFTGGGGLALDVSGSGYPAVGTGAASLGLHAGSTVTYRVWAPEGVAAGVAPMLFDQDWRVAVLADCRLSPGWNTITFMLPPAIGTPQVLGLQVNDGSGWAGRLVLDAVAL